MSFLNDCLQFKFKIQQVIVGYRYIRTSDVLHDIVCFKLLSVEVFYFYFVYPFKVDDYILSSYKISCYSIKCSRIVPHTLSVQLEIDRYNLLLYVLNKSARNGNRFCINNTTFI